MSAPPYMRLYWGDYHKATRHLMAREHGAYLLLIGEAWERGGALPDDDAKLCAWARCTPAEWAEIKPIVMDFFTLRRGRWTHNRVTQELASYETTSRKRKEAGKKGGSVSGGKCERNSEAIASRELTNSPHNQNQNHSHIEEPPVVPQGTEAFELEAEQPPAPDDVRIAFDEWNALAARTGLPTAKVLSDDRRRAISGRLKVGGLDLWRLALKNVEASAFLRGQRTGSNGQPFKADLAFVCQAKSFSKLIDGSYGADASRSRVPDDEHARIRRELEALL